MGLDTPERWLAFVAACFVALLCLVSYPVFSQQMTPEHEQLHKLYPFYETWMRPDNRATSCCSRDDCAPAPSKFEGGNWHAFVHGQWVVIPKEKIETERDSPDGRSHVCVSKPGWWGNIYVWCFLPAGGA